MENASVSNTRSGSTVRVDQSGAVVIVGIWAWLFTIGYLHLTFWKGVLAIVLWPVYIGWALSAAHGGP
jgi:hypothetical protein